MFTDQSLDNQSSILPRPIPALLSLLPNVVYSFYIIPIISIYIQPQISARSSAFVGRAYIALHTKWRLNQKVKDHKYLFWDWWCDCTEMLLAHTWTPTQMQWHTHLHIVSEALNSFSVEMHTVQQSSVLLCLKVMDDFFHIIFQIICTLQLWPTNNYNI